LNAKKKKEIEVYEIGITFNIVNPNMFDKLEVTNLVGNDFSDDKHLKGH
jgi:hypothetical protein